MLHLVGCLYYLYQWCTVKQISDNEIYLLIKYIKSVLWSVVKRLSYKQDAHCLKVNLKGPISSPINLSFIGNVACHKEVDTVWPNTAWQGTLLCSRIAVSWCLVHAFSRKRVYDNYDKFGYRKDVRLWIYSMKSVLDNVYCLKYA